MKKTFPILLILILAACRSSHDGVDDEYSRGFLNCLSIIEHNHPEIRASRMPYWKECKRSFAGGGDLFNDWDSTYFISPGQHPSYLIDNSTGRRVTDCGGRIRIDTVGHPNGHKAKIKYW